MAEEKREVKPAHARRVLLRPRQFECAEVLAQREGCDVAEIVNRAMKELADRAGVWETKPADSTDKK